MKLIRRRYIPAESIPLDQDEVLYADEKLIVTRWKTLKPRKDFAYGISALFVDQGIKVSKFMDQDHKLVYYYCDIVFTEFDKDTCIINDLFLDVIVYPDGHYRLVDMDEFAKAMEENLLPKQRFMQALYQADALLTCLYQDKFKDYIKIIEQY